MDSSANNSRPKSSRNNSDVFDEDDDNNVGGEGDAPEMDLDFHIQFPTPKLVECNGNLSEKNDGEEHVEQIWPIPGYQDKDTSQEDNKEVVVVLLGWAGSNHKNLAKYSDIYLKRG